MKVVIDIPEILLDRIKSTKCIPDMYGSDIVNTVVCVSNAAPYEERPHGMWIPCSERLPEDPDTKHIFASKTYQVTNYYGKTIVLLWCKTEIRGKTVMRWEWHDGRIYHGDVLAWKPLSEPYKREGEKE